MAQTTSQMPNRLIHEQSPYLLQHAHNPVDWYPWGEEAFARAQAEEKLVFLSIGYSTCHWCHVMERESFESPDIAALLNEHFISVKVDREEHPDVDQLYMNAVMTMTGHGGWPLTVFLTPDRRPFFGGTYFPPDQRGGMTGMRQLLPAIAMAWRAKRPEVLASADGLTRALQDALAAGDNEGPLDPDILHRAFNQAVQTFDPAHGGFGSAPKFPRSHELSFLLSYWARTRSGQALEIVTTTLDHLARGGIYDHLGGGVHRYSTDAQWLVPHFEKMLYDQALLARTYLEAYRATGTAWYAEVARGILDYVLRDLRDPDGGFYSAEDADSEGEEGKFYVWTPEEVLTILGPNEGALFNRVYGVTAEGNFEHAANILHLDQDLETFARLKDMDPAGLASRLARARTQLREVRARRVRPHRDDKILTGWNGLMIASFAYAAATLDEPRYLEAARDAAAFVLANLRRQDMLLRRYRGGEAKYPGSLEDYAFFAYGLLELYEAGFDPAYLMQALEVTSQLQARFWDQEHGGFFLRDQREPSLLVQAKQTYDGATPSGNSVAALVLLRLGRMTADTALEDLGRRTLEAFAVSVGRTPFGYPQMLIAWDMALGPTQEIVIAGNPDDVDTRVLLDVLRRHWLPRTVTLLHSDGAQGKTLETLAPYVRAQRPIGGRPAAYVCENFVCNLPVTGPDALEELLAAPAARR